MSQFPQPVTDAASDPFWEGTKGGRLLIQRCPATGKYQWYPRAHSIHAANVRPEWVEASGRGTVFSFTTIHRGNVKLSAPYAVALIKLDEGVVMYTRLVLKEGELPQIGMPVEVVFPEPENGFVLPAFRRREAA